MALRIDDWMKSKKIIALSSFIFFALSVTAFLLWASYPILGFTPSGVLWEVICLSLWSSGILVGLGLIALSDYFGINFDFDSVFFIITIYFITVSTLLICFNTCPVLIGFSVVFFLISLVCLYKLIRSFYSSHTESRPLTRQMDALSSKIEQVESNINDHIDLKMQKMDQKLMQVKDEVKEEIADVKEKVAMGNQQTNQQFNAINQRMDQAEKDRKEADKKREQENTEILELLRKLTAQGNSHIPISQSQPNVDCLPGYLQEMLKAFFPNFHFECILSENKLFLQCKTNNPNIPSEQVEENFEIVKQALCKTFNIRHGVFLDTQKSTLTLTGNTTQLEKCFKALSYDKYLRIQVKPVSQKSQPYGFFPSVQNSFSLNTKISDEENWPSVDTTDERGEGIGCLIN